MTFIIDLQDKTPLRAKRERRIKLVKKGFKVCLHGLIIMRVSMRGMSGIIEYGKYTATFKIIDTVTAKIMKL